MFNISFLNSAILGALIAAVIPLIIHFFVKYKPKLIKFSSLKYIKKIQQNKARYIKIRQLLLLILRILIILFVVLALSRPVLKSIFTSDNWKNHAPTTVVIIVDNSYSMNYLLKDETVLDRAKAKTQEILSMLNDKDRVMILTQDQNYNDTHNYFSHKDNVIKYLEEINITDRSVNLAEVVATAEKKLDEVDIINKEIYLLTDNQQYNWHDFTEKNLKLSSDLFVIPLLNPQNIKNNIATLSVTYIPSLLTDRDNSEVRAVIKNFSDQKQNDLLVTLRINNVIEAERAISINPYQEKSVVFSLGSGETQLSFGEVSVKDRLLPDDNTWYFDFNPEQSPKILLVSNIKLEKEIESIFDLITDSDYEIMKPNELSSAKIEEFNLFVFYNNSDITERTQFYLNLLEEKEKGVMVIPGQEEIDPNLVEWLEKKRLSFDNIFRQSTTINYLNYLHPLTSGLSLDMFNSVRINSIWQVSEDDYLHLLGTSAGPVLSIKNKLLVACTNFTAEWTNLIYKPVFPILFYNIANYLGKDNPDLITYRVGEPFQIDITGAVECKLPNGEVVPLIVEDKNMNSFTNTDWQGHYFIHKDNSLQKIFSYNCSRQESNISLLTKEEKENIGKVYSQIHFLDNDNWREQILTSRYGYGLWDVLLWLVLFLLIIEMFLAYSGRKNIFK